MSLIEDKDAPQAESPTLSMGDIPAIIIAITFLSTALSFIFNASYFLSINPSLLMLFSPTDYFSTGIFFVVTVIVTAILNALVTDGSTKLRTLKQKNKTRLKEKKRQEKLANLAMQEDDYSSYEEAALAFDKMVNKFKRHIWLSRLTWHSPGIAIWLLFSFPRLDWLVVSIILHELLLQVIHIQDKHIKSKIAIILKPYIIVSTLIVFYTGAMCTFVLPLNVSTARIVYEQKDNIIEVEGRIIRILSKSVIVKTIDGLLVLDRDTPLQIFYDKNSNPVDANGIWWHLKNPQQP